MAASYGENKRGGKGENGTNPDASVGAGGAGGRKETNPQLVKIKSVLE